MPISRPLYQRLKSVCMHRSAPRAQHKQQTGGKLLATFIFICINFCVKAVHSGCKSCFQKNGLIHGGFNEVSGWVQLVFFSSFFTHVAQPVIHSPFAIKSSVLLLFSPLYTGPTITTTIYIKYIIVVMYRNLHINFQALFRTALLPFLNNKSQGVPV